MLEFDVVSAKAGIQWLSIFAQGMLRLFFATEAGGCPAARYFLLLRQKKVPKEKATPGSSPFGFPALLTNAGRCGTRGSNLRVRKWFRSRSPLKQSSRTSPAFAALLGDSHGGPGHFTTTENKTGVFPAQAGIQVLSMSNSQLGPLPSPGRQW